MNAHLSVITYERARTARDIVQTLIVRDGVIDPVEAMALAACEDAETAAHATRTAYALAHAIERPTLTPWYLDKLLEARQRAMDELG